MEIEEIEKMIGTLREQVSCVIELPEPALKLDMVSRGGDKLRQFNYLHQMCLLHAENFAIATQIKIVALVDGYLDNVNSESSLGTFLFSRSLLELAAFLHDVNDRLTLVKQEADEKWRPKGEQFFRTIMRARFGTSNPQIAKDLKESGASKKCLEPLNVMQSLAKLMASKEGKSMNGKYDFLCDYVHHNLSSNYTSSSGYRVGTSAHAQGGGGIFMPNKGPIARYEYPVPTKAHKAKSETIEVVAQSLKICISTLNKMPRTPYKAEQLEAMTGSKLGFKTLSGIYTSTFK